MTTTAPANETRREAFGEKSLATTGETHTSALVAAAQASVNARYIMALQRPRNWDDVRVRLLADCQRPGFAKAARYKKPIGKGVEGPSIRFAEACYRYAGNLDAPVTTIFEDRSKRIVRLQVIDLETNASHGAEITIDKTVERRQLGDRVLIAERKNTSGAPVFIVEATEDELLNKQNALVSKALRTIVLRLMPADIVDEGQAACIETMRHRDAADPAGARKDMADAFAKLGVFPKDLAAFLGHSLDAVQPAELEELRGIWATLNDGEATWAAVLEAKRGPKADGAAASTDLESKLRAKKGAKDASPPVAKGEASTVTVHTERPCVDCGKPVGDDAVASWTRDGEEGWRHSACRAPEAP